MTAMTKIPTTLTLIAHARKMPVPASSAHQSLEKACDRCRRNCDQQHAAAIMKQTMGESSRM